MKCKIFDECSNVHAAPPYFVMPRAANTAFAGLARLKAGQTDNVMSIEPSYIRRSEAEELWEKRQKEHKNDDKI